MARGWESKAVEEQINEHQSEVQSPKTMKLTTREKERRTKRDGLLLARKHTVDALESSRDARYRAFLERTLVDLNAQLTDLETRTKD